MACSVDFKGWDLSDDKGRSYGSKIMWKCGNVEMEEGVISQLEN